MPRTTDWCGGKVEVRAKIRKAILHASVKIEEVRSRQRAKRRSESRKFGTQKQGRGWPISLAAHRATFCSSLIGRCRETGIFRKCKCSHKRRSHTLRQPQILLQFYRHYYNHTAVLDRLLEEVSAYVAMAYVMARSGRHNTKENFFAS